MGQDMFWGFTTDIIYKYQVRWIEIAAIMPMWTHMIVYYVEGNEGHVMSLDIFSGAQLCNALGTNVERI